MQKKTQNQPQPFDPKTPTPISTIFKHLKQGNILNAKKHEINQKLLNEIYSLKPKTQRKYNIVEKKTIFDKEITKHFHDNFSFDNYYSNYQSFRDYLMTGFTPEYVALEISTMRSLIDFSRDWRKGVRGHFKMPTEGIAQSSEGTNLQNSPPQAQTGADGRSAQKRWSAFFSTVRWVTGFIQKCKLLKLKSLNNDDYDDNYQFRLYSQLSKETDQHAVPRYENFINIKYYNQKSKLTKAYHTEHMFIDCVRNVKLRLKSDPTKNTTSGTINLSSVSQKVESKFSKDNMNDMKKAIHVPKIQSWYYGRDVEYFRKIDNFVSWYRENSNQMKNREKDLFNHIYEILTKCNYDCVNFMSYLYTKSPMFKYIYDIFTLDNRFYSMDFGIPAIMKDQHDEFLNESYQQLFTDKEEKNKKQRDTPKLVEPKKTKLIKQDTNLFDTCDMFFGCLFMDGLVFISEEYTSKDMLERASDIAQGFKMSGDDTYFLISRDREVSVFKVNRQNEAGGNVFFINSVSIHNIKIFKYNETEYPSLYFNRDEVVMYIKVSIEYNHDNDEEKHYMFKMEKDIYERLRKLNDEEKLNLFLVKKEEKGRLRNSVDYREEISNRNNFSMSNM